MHLPPLDRLLALLSAADALQGELTLEEACARLGVGRDELPDVIAALGTLGVPPFGPEDLIDVAIDGDWVVIDPPDGLRGPVRPSARDGALALATLEALAVGGGPELRARCERVAAAIRTAVESRQRALAWATEDADPVLLDRMLRAAAEHRTVRLRYHNASRDAVEARTVVALRLVRHGGRWYLRAASDGGLRWFRADRVVDVEVGDVTQVEIQDAAPVRRPVLYDAPTLGLSALVRFDATDEERVQAWWPAAVREGPAFRVTASTVPVLLRELLAFGGSWELLGPPEIRQILLQWLACA